MYGTGMFPILSVGVFLTNLSVKKVKDNENFLKITLFLPIKQYKFRKSRSDFDF